MRNFLMLPLLILGLLGLVYGLMGLTSDGAIHETEGLIGFLIFAVVIGAAYVGSAITELMQRVAPMPVQQPVPQMPYQMPPAPPQ